MKKHQLFALFLAVVMLLSLLSGCEQEQVNTTAPESTGEHTHVDADNNGLCDSCAQSVLVSFDFYALNDLHGKLDDTDSNIGADELTTYLKAAVEASQNGYVLSTGDMWQGSAESNMTYGALMTDWMNELDFVSMTLGNHEFDWGREYIERNLELAEFPFLAINIYERETDTLASYCSPSVMIESDGIQIGIIGAIGDCYSSIMKDKVADVYFKTGSELTKLVQEESEKLRSQGADFIIYSLHDGYERSASGTVTQLGSYYDTALSDGYVDLVFEGHIHKSYVFQDEYGVYHLQGGGENDGLTHAQLQFNTANGSTQVAKAEFVSNDVYGKLESDPIVDELLDKYQEQLGSASEVLGKNDFDRSKGTIAQLVAQLYYEFGVETWGAEYDIILGGGFISPRDPYKLASGDVTYAMLHTLMPFDNQLTLCSIRGTELRSKFIETQNDRYYIYGRSDKWKDIDLNGTYYVVVDAYTATYAPNRLTIVKEYEEAVYARDLLAQYIRDGGLTTTTNDDNYTLTSIEDILALGNGLSGGETTRDAYYVKGTVQSIASAQYGNLTIADEKGNTLYVYGIYDITGKLGFAQMENPPKVGVTVILCAAVQRYVPMGGSPVVELYQARVIEMNS